MTHPLQGEPQCPAPIFLALVDVSRGADDGFLELVRTGLLTALETLPPYTLFGLITFGKQVGCILASLACTWGVLINTWATTVILDKKKQRLMLS